MLDHIHERPLINILETEAFRALLAPFGHITWTALLGGALFASSRAGRFHLTTRLVGTFAGVVALHAVWDQTYGWAVMLSEGVTGAGWTLRWPNQEFWSVEPSAGQLVWFNVFYDAILAIVALIGLVWILREWHVYGGWRAARRDASRGLRASPRVVSSGDRVIFSRAESAPRARSPRGSGRPGGIRRGARTPTRPLARIAAGRGAVGGPGRP
jgi:hypothetical protein